MRMCPAHLVGITGHKTFDLRPVTFGLVCDRKDDLKLPFAGVPQAFPQAVSLLLT